MIIVTAAAGYLSAQDTDSAEGGVESTPTSLFSSESDESGQVQQIETTSGVRPEPVAEPEASESRAMSSDAEDTEEGAEPESSEDNGSLLSKVQWNATADMQVDKEMWDEFYDKSPSNVQTYNLTKTRHRTMVDDFWMRVALRAKFRTKYFESAFALRFYPYWTLRRQGPFRDGEDLDRYLDVLEINQAYLKTFKEYTRDDTKWGVFFKVGRDGLLTTGSQLFGNYLELPTGGYGETLKPNVTGPFLNRKVFANMMETGFSFTLGDLMSGKTSLMVGGNFNNKKWYSSGSNPESELLDSKLTAGFTRGYQDLYFWKDRIHLGGGYRVYTTYVDDAEYRPVQTAAGADSLDDSGEVVTEYVEFQGQRKYRNGEWVVDVTFTPDCKLYTEFGFQKLGVGSSTGVIRPFTAGITIPTGKVLDVLAVEVENVSDTYFNDKSMRDQVGTRKGTKSFAWGIVTEKWLLKDRVCVDWGVYTGSAYGDMKTSFRLTSNFN